MHDLSTTMTSEKAQIVSLPTTRAKRRVITSCLECYRRKQKCDRVKPCNFCSARGVPERCRYNEALQHDARTSSMPSDGHNSSSPKSNIASYTPPTSESPSSFVDQVGYSTSSRRNQFETLGGAIVNTTTNHMTLHQTLPQSTIDTYLILVARIPAENITEKLVQIYFPADYWSFPILDEHHFIALLSQYRKHSAKGLSARIVRQLPPELLLFPALLCSVLASSLPFVNTETDVAHELGLETNHDCDRLSQSYIDTGQEIIELFKQQKPCTTSIEYHLIKLAWLKNFGRGGEAWQCLGVALRQAQEIDLHQIQEGNPQPPGLTLEQKLLHLWETEHQKRLWARIFVMDSHMAVALGRPRGIHREDCSTPLPLDCDYPSNPGQTVPISTNHTCNPPNSFSPIMFSITLAHKYHDLMSLRASKLDLKDHSCVQGLHDEIESLLNELPPAMRPSFPDTTWDHQMPILPTIRLRLFLSAQNFLLVLHRPHVSTHVASRYAATKAAFMTLRAQNELFLIVPQAQHRLYGHSFYAIDAATFLAAVVMKSPTFNANVCAQVLQAVQQAGSQLGLMKHRNRIARTGELVLQRCCAAIETIMPSPSSIVSHESFESLGQSMELDDMSFLQDFSTLVPDQATREMIGFLSDPSSLMNTSATTSFPLDKTVYDDSDFLLVDPFPTTAAGQPNPVTLDQSDWQF